MNNERGKVDIIKRRLLDQQLLDIRQATELQNIKIENEELFNQKLVKYDQYLTSVQQDHENQLRLVIFDFDCWIYPPLCILSSEVSSIL